MKAVLLVLSLLVASALAADCTRDDSTSGRISNCDDICDGTFPSSDALVTSNPVILVRDTSADSNPAANPDPILGQTRFINDKVEIVFRESAKYYGHASEGAIDAVVVDAYDVTQDDDSATNPRIQFGSESTRVVSGVVEQAKQKFPASSGLPPAVNDRLESSGCNWEYTLVVNWGNFLARYSSNGDKVTPTAFNAFKYTAPLLSNDFTARYDIDFSVINYEHVSIVRPSGTITQERTIRHALPFAITFQTQAAITTTSIQVYSNIDALAAIVSQSVELTDFNGNAKAELLLYTSVQAPFVIDELRIVQSTRTDILGDSEAEVGTLKYGSGLNARAYSATKYGAVGATQGLWSNDGPGEAKGGQAYVRGSYAESDPADSTCKSSDGVCTQVWPLGLAIEDSNGLNCNFDGTYTVYFTIRCHPGAAFNAPGYQGVDQCPINLNNLVDPAARVILGSEGASVGSVRNKFVLQIQSTYHCTKVVDTIGLEADLYTHGQPISSSPANLNRADSAQYNSVTGKVVSVGTSAIPFPPYSYAPVSASGDPDNAKWGPSEGDGPVTFDITDASLDGKTAFLNGQWVFGVGLVKVSQATVVKAEFSSLTISGFSGSAVPSGSTSRNVILNSAVNDPDTVSALKLAFVDDTTSVNINTPENCIAYPYFFFQVSQEAFGIPGDGNIPITFTGVIKVTYENAASIGEEVEKLVPFSYTMQANSNSKGQSVSTSIGIGNGASGSASTANSTFLGVSSSTAAGVALAVGVVVGLLVGLLVSATRRRPAPTKTDSQVQLTSSAATSAV